MQNKLFMLAIGIFVCLGQTLAVVLWRDPPHEGPQSIPEAVALARQKGLYCVGDSLSGTSTHTVVISEMPLTWEEGNNLVMKNQLHPRWIGKVRIYSRWRSMAWSEDSCFTMVWGQLLVYGDPQLIEKLTGSQPSRRKTGGQH